MGPFLLITIFHDFEWHIWMIYWSRFASFLLTWYWILLSALLKPLHHLYLYIVYLIIRQLLKDLLLAQLHANTFFMDYFPSMSFLMWIASERFPTLSIELAFPQCEHFPLQSGIRNHWRMFFLHYTETIFSVWTLSRLMTPWLMEL